MRVRYPELFCVAVALFAGACGDTKSGGAADGNAGASGSTASGGDRASGGAFPAEQLPRAVKAVTGPVATGAAGAEPAATQLAVAAVAAVVQRAERRTEVPRAAAPIRAVMPESRRTAAERVASAVAARAEHQERRAPTPRARPEQAVPRARRRHRQSGTLARKTVSTAHGATHPFPSVALTWCVLRANGRKAFPSPSASGHRPAFARAPRPNDPARARPATSARGVPTTTARCALARASRAEGPVARRCPCQPGSVIGRPRIARSGHRTRAPHVAAI